MKINRAAYAVADALQQQIRPDGMTLGQKQVKLGPVQVSFPLRVRVDQFSENEVGALIHFRGHLWGYMHSIGTTGSLTLVLFDGGTSGFEAFTTGNAAATLKKIRPKIAALFNYSDKVWVQGETSSLDEVR